MMNKKPPLPVVWIVIPFQPFQQSVQAGWLSVVVFTVCLSAAFWLRHKQRDVM